ncbi:hypothetical protein E2C01_101518 [Portunus trituberculatus]|uniref:Uncharacterized protein n=1 Tax=Portunus trituberculatus TaxID=210409 RepID=A0A5B7KAY7_PORTR|nr:hypothetical protein [Portunus trituberculatus]
MAGPPQAPRRQCPAGHITKSVTVTNRRLRSHFLHNVPFLFTWRPHRGKVHVLPRKRVSLEVSVLTGKWVAHKVSVLSHPFIHFPGEGATAVVWTHPIDMYHDCSVPWATSKPVGHVHQRGQHSIWTFPRTLELGGLPVFPLRVVQPDSTAHLVLGPPAPPQVLTRHGLARQLQVLRHTLPGSCHSLVQCHHILGRRSRQLLPWRPPGREI